MDIEGAVLDYKTPEEMLHEKNAEFRDKDKKTDEGEDAAEGEADAAEEGEAGDAAEEGN